MITGKYQYGNNGARYSLDGKTIIDFSGNALDPRSPCLGTLKNGTPCSFYGSYANAGYCRRHKKT